MKRKRLSLKKGIRHLSWGEIATLIRTTFVEFFKEKSFLHGAALSYYTLFALVPMLYLAFATFGEVVGHKTMIEIIGKMLRENVGIKDVNGILSFLNELDIEKGSFVLNVFGITALVISSSALLMSLKGSLNEFFDIDRAYVNPRKFIVNSLVSRLVSVLLLTVFGLITVVLYFAQTFLVSFGSKLLGDVDTLYWLFLQTAQHGIAILSNLLIFTLIFRYLHDGVVRWKLALSGAAVTSVMLYVGQLLIKFYIGKYFFAKDGGIAGTLMVILVWTYYSSQIIFFGAKYTTVYAKMVGRPILVKK